tara:strand:- start:10626 stop:11351 length:726 start_codon:yes stop_codon:yes gene_type:complete
MNQAVLLLGGRGSRLKPLTNYVPKPMVLINNYPFLDYLLNELIKSGYNNFVFLCGYKHTKIIERYKHLNLEKHFVIGNVSDNPEKRLIKAKRFLHEKFILLYGDNFWPIHKEIRIYKNLMKKNKGKIGMVSYSNKKGTGEYGSINNIKYNNSFLVEKYGKSMKHNSIDIGFFIIFKKLLNKNGKNYSFKSFIKRQIVNKNLLTYVTDLQYYYITNLASLSMFNDYVLKYNVKPIPEIYFKR